jgi:hypothetical protein
MSSSDQVARGGVSSGADTGAEPATPASPASSSAAGGAAATSSPTSSSASGASVSSASSKPAARKGSPAVMRLRLLGRNANDNRQRSSGANATPGMGETTWRRDVQQASWELVQLKSFTAWANYHLKRYSAARFVCGSMPACSLHLGLCFLSLSSPLTGDCFLFSHLSLSITVSLPTSLPTTLQRTLSHCWPALD